MNRDNGPEDQDMNGEATRPTEAGMSVPPSAEYLRREAARLLELAGERDRVEAQAILAAREAARPKEPVFGEDERPAVAFTRYQAGREYHYAAIGWVEGRSKRWAVTGAETRRFNWPGLLEFIGEANWPSLVRMTTGENLAQPGMEVPLAEVMGRYGRVELTEQLGVPFDPFHGVPGVMVISHHTGVDPTRPRGLGRQ